jgi:hypothetical protein
VIGGIAANAAGGHAKPAAATPPPVASAPASPAPSQPATPPPTPSQPAAPVVGQLGDSATVTDSSGNQYSFTPTQVIDPAQPASQYDTAGAGQHFVGVIVKVTSISGTVNDAADNCATLLGFNGQAYSTTVSSIAGYDNTTTMIKLNAGESQTLAVVFQVPNGVHPSSVKWNPRQRHGRPDGHLERLTGQRPARLR